jgi:sRNA-binding protein
MTENMTIAAVRQLLHARFPGVFKGKGQMKIPLAIGIHRQLFEAVPELSHTKIRNTLFDYTNGPLYYRALKPGAPRLNLDGTVAGTVSERDAWDAVVRVRKMRKAWRARKRSVSSQVQAAEAA